MRDLSGALVGETTFDNMGNGAGGWVSRLDIAPDDTIIVGCDTTGPFLRKPGDTRWRQLFNPGVTIDPAELDAMTASGNWGDNATYDVCISKSDSNYLLFATAGYVWKSTDGGDHSTRTALPYDNSMLMDGARTTGRRLAFDPASSHAIIAYGSRGYGLKYSLDGGATWATNASIPVSTAGDPNVLIAFDAASASGGKCQVVYVLSAGNGLLKSTTGIDGTFSSVAGGRANASTIVCAGGKLFVAGLGNLLVLTGTTWADTGVASRAVCADPADSTKIWVANDGGNLAYSADSGATFTGMTGLTRVATDYPWLAWCNEGYMSCGDIQICPISRKMIFAEGIGVWTTTPPTTAQNVTWTSMSEGINQLVAVNIGVASNGRVVTSSHDRAFFSFARENVGVPSLTHGASRDHFSINHGQQADWAIDDPTFWVGTFTYGYLSGSPLGGVVQSTDNAQTWDNVPVMPKPASVEGWGTIFGGNIAVSTKLNWLYMSTNGTGSWGARPQYTLDGGNTWHDCVFNATYDGQTPWHNAYTLNRSVLVADKANAGTFFVYNIGNGNGDAADLATAGIWKTTNGGVTWTRTHAGRLISWGVDFWNGKLKMTSHSHLSWVGGGEGGYFDPPSANGIRFSRDGATWAEIAGLHEVADVAWGAPKPGAAYDTPYAYGWRVGGVRGLYRMDDFNPLTASGTWTLIDRWPRQIVGGNIVLAADPVKYGRVYIGLAGAGFYYGDYTHWANGH